MKAKKSAKIIFPLLSLGLLGGVVGSSIASFAMQNVHSEAPLFQEQYKTGDLIEVPSIEIDGTPAEKQIIYPNGRVFVRDSFVPEEIGYYTVRYVANEKVQEHKFYVAGQKYTVEGTGSAEFKAHPLTPSKESLVVSLGANSKFTFNEIININNLGKKNIIDFYLMAAKPGNLDAYTIKIRATDVYDETKYLQYEIDASRQGYTHQAVYMRAGGENQIPTGVETHSGKIFQGTIFGYAYPATFYCCTPDLVPFNEGQLINNRIGLGYNPASMIATSLPNTEGSTFMVDLNDPTYFTEFWEGLTTGEAKVSVWFENFAASSASICVTSIGGANISSDTLIDTEAPSLEIDDLFGELPNAIINQKYRFYEATTLDPISGKLPTSIRVYRDYYGDKVEVAKDLDGFTPTRLGTYYIEYTGQDYSENKTTKVYKVNCVNETKSYDLALNPGYKTSGYVGEIIDLATVEVSGATGIAKGHIQIVDPDGNVVKLEENKFTPSKEGTHKVEYVYTDFVGTIETISYDLAVTISAAPLINDNVTLLPYYLAGYDYTLPSLHGIDYNVGEGEPVDAKIQVIDGDKTYDAADGLINLPAGTTQAREVTVRYTCENNNAEAHKDYNVKVITTSTDGFVHMENYFDTKDVTITPTKTTLEFETTKSGTATFTNNLAINGFETNFSIPEERSSFEKLNVYIKDSLNPNQQIKISWFADVEGFTKTQVNDDKMFTYSGVGYFKGGLQFLKINAETKRIQTNPNEIIPVKTYLDGTPFNGFSSDSVYMTFEFVNANGGLAGITLTDINSQEMSNSKYDYIRPRVILKGNYGGARNIGEIYELCGAEAYDVLDPNPTIDLTLTDKDNNVIKDTSGKEIKNVASNQSYKFKVEKYGFYRVSYHASDLDENDVYFAYVITVDDKVDPVIKVDGKLPTTAKVGDTITPAKASATDNLTAKENIKLVTYVIAPNGVVHKLKNGSFTFTLPGTHVVRYIAIDEAGNTSYVDYKIQVSEAK